MLDLDISVLYTIIILWFLLVILNRIFYKPVGKVIAEREKKIEKETSGIEELTIEIGNRSSEIESILKKAKKDSISASEELIRKGELAREELLDGTREKSNEIFKAKMEDLEKEITSAENKLKGEIKIFSKKIEKIFS